MQLLDGINDDGVSGTSLYADDQGVPHIVEWHCDYIVPEPTRIDLGELAGLVDALQSSSLREWPRCLPSDPVKGPCYRSLAAMRQWDATLDAWVLTGVLALPAWWRDSEDV